MCDMIYRYECLSFIINDKLLIKLFNDIVGLI